MLSVSLKCFKPFYIPHTKRSSPWQMKLLINISYSQINLIWRKAEVCIVWLSWRKTDSWVTFCFGFFSPTSNYLILVGHPGLHKYLKALHIRACIQYLKTVFLEQDSILTLLASLLTWSRLCVEKLMPFYWPARLPIAWHHLFSTLQCYLLPFSQQQYINLFLGMKE